MGSRKVKELLGVLKEENSNCSQVFLESVKDLNLFETSNKCMDDISCIASSLSKTSQSSRKRSPASLPNTSQSSPKRSPAPSIVSSNCTASPAAISVPENQDFGQDFADILNHFHLHPDDIRPDSNSDDSHLYIDANISDITDVDLDEVVCEFTIFNVIQRCNSNV